MNLAEKKVNGFPSPKQRAVTGAKADMLSCRWGVPMQWLPLLAGCFLCFFFHWEEYSFFRCWNSCDLVLFLQVILCLGCVIYHHSLWLAFNCWDHKIRNRSIEEQSCFFLLQFWWWGAPLWYQWNTAGELTQAHQMLTDLSWSISWLKLLSLNVGKPVNLAAPRPDLWGRAGDIWPLAAQPLRANTPALIDRDAPVLLHVLPLPQPASAQPFSQENAKVE